MRNQLTRHISQAKLRDICYYSAIRYLFLRQFFRHFTIAVFPLYKRVEKMVVYWLDEEDFDIRPDNRPSHIKDSELYSNYGLWSMSIPSGSQADAPNFNVEI
jgi:hypothetical protein